MYAWFAIATGDATTLLLLQYTTFESIHVAIVSVAYLLLGCVVTFSAAGRTLRYSLNSIFAGIPAIVFVIGGVFGQKAIMLGSAAVISWTTNPTLYIARRVIHASHSIKVRAATSTYVSSACVAAFAPLVLGGLIPSEIAVPVLGSVCATCVGMFVHRHHVTQIESTRTNRPNVAPIVVDTGYMPACKTWYAHTCVANMSVASMLVACAIPITSATQGVTFRIIAITAIGSTTAMIAMVADTTSMRRYMRNLRVLVYYFLVINLSYIALVLTVPDVWPMWSSALSLCSTPILTAHTVSFSIWAPVTMSVSQPGATRTALFRWEGARWAGMLIGLAGPVICERLFGTTFFPVAAAVCVFVLYNVRIGYAAELARDGHPSAVQMAADAEDKADNGRGL